MQFLVAALIWQNKLTKPVDKAMRHTVRVYWALVLFVSTWNGCRWFEATLRSNNRENSSLPPRKRALLNKNSERKTKTSSRLPSRNKEAYITSRPSLISTTENENVETPRQRNAQLFKNAMQEYVLKYQRVQAKNQLDFLKGDKRIVGGT